MNQEAKRITGEDCFNLLDQYAVDDMTTDDIGSLLKLIEKDGAETVYEDLLGTIDKEVGEVPESDPGAKRRLGFTAGDLLESLATYRVNESDAEL